MAGGVAGPAGAGEDVVEGDVLVEDGEGAVAVLVEAEDVPGRSRPGCPAGLGCGVGGDRGEELVEGVGDAVVFDDAAGPGRVRLAVDGARDTQDAGEVADAGSVLESEVVGGPLEDLLPRPGCCGGVGSCGVVEDEWLVEQPPRVVPAAGVHPQGRGGQPSPGDDGACCVLVTWQREPGARLVAFGAEVDVGPEPGQGVGVGGSAALSGGQRPGEGGGAQVDAPGAGLVEAFDAVEGGVDVGDVAAGAAEDAAGVHLDDRQPAGGLGVGALEPVACVVEVEAGHRWPTSRSRQAWQRPTMRRRRGPAVMTSVKNSGPGGTWVPQRSHRRS